MTVPFALPSHVFVLAVITLACSLTCPCLVTYIIIADPRIVGGPVKLNLRICKGLLLNLIDRLLLRFVCLLLFYTIGTVFQLYHNGDMIYEIS